MNRMNGSISMTGARCHLDIAVALVSVIPFLALAVLGRVSFVAFDLSPWQWVVLMVGVVSSPLLGYSLLLKYPATVMKLRTYLDDIVRGELPDQIDLVQGETDIVAIEKAMNLVVERLRSRARSAEMQNLRLEEELLLTRKLEAVGTLAAGIAHEINTPLQFISTNLAFIGRELNSGHIRPAADAPAPVAPDNIAEIGSCVSESQEGVGRIADIVRAMSVYAERGEEGVMKPINLNAAIESVIEVSRNVWKCDARCVTELDPCLPAVNCLAGEIKQVVMNLLINAVDAIKAQHDASGDTTLGEIRILTHGDDDNVTITISDTGIGIEPTIRDRIFEPFFTTDATRRHRGQGLTLAYASVVKRHGGRLSFESSPEMGATFCVELPIRSDGRDPQGGTHAKQ